jgi:hypothetical protein
MNISLDQAREQLAAAGATERPVGADGYWSLEAAPAAA